MSTAVKKAAQALQDTVDESGVTMTVETDSGSATLRPGSGYQQQLSFDVGGQPPDIAILKIGGGIVMHSELEKGDEVHVQIADADGEVVADGYCRITQVAFKDRFDDQGNVVGSDRTHTASVSKHE